MKKKVGNGTYRELASEEGNGEIGLFLISIYYVCLGRVSRFKLCPVFLWIFEPDLLQSCKRGSVRWFYGVSDAKVSI